jgi:hypothetical protein
LPGVFVCSVFSFCFFLGAPWAISYFLLWPCRLTACGGREASMQATRQDFIRIPSAGSSQKRAGSRGCTGEVYPNPAPPSAGAHGPRGLPGGPSERRLTRGRARHRETERPFAIENVCTRLVSPPIFHSRTWVLAALPIQAHEYNRNGDVYRTVYSKHYRSALGAVALDPKTEALPLSRTYTQYPTCGKYRTNSVIDGVVAVAFMCLDGQDGKCPWRWVEDRGGYSNLYLA